GAGKHLDRDRLFQLDRRGRSAVRGVRGRPIVGRRRRSAGAGLRQERRERHHAGAKHAPPAETGIPPRRPALIRPILFMHRLLPLATAYETRTALENSAASARASLTPRFCCSASLTTSTILLRICPYRGCCGTTQPFSSES